MPNNKIRGRPKKKDNRIRDADIIKKIKKDIDEIAKRASKYLKKNKKKLLPYVAFAIVGDKLSFAYRSSNARDFISRITDTINSFNKFFEYPILSLNYRDILAGIITALAVRLMLYIKMAFAKPGSILSFAISECLLMALAVALSLLIGAAEYKVKKRKFSLNGDMAVIPGFAVVMIAVMATGFVERFM